MIKIPEKYWGMIWMLITIMVVIEIYGLFQLLKRAGIYHERSL